MLLVGALGAADDAAFTRELFRDDFSAAELGSAWKLFKAESGVQDGVLVAGKPDGGDHNGTASIVFESAADVAVDVRFRFVGEDSFSLTLNDKGYKGSHAGHIARISVSLKRVVISDEKTGIFKNEIFAQKQKDPATIALLKTKSKIFPTDLSGDGWHHLEVRCAGDTITVVIDEREVGRFAGEGFAHPTKNKLALVVPGKFVHFDDVVLRVR